MRYIFALIAFAMFCLSAMAIDVRVAGTVYVYDQPKDVSIKIVNASDSTQQFTVQFNAPTQFELSQTNGSIAGNSSKTVTLTVFPRSDLTGQTYESKLEITLGKERYIKQLGIVFRGEKEQASGPSGEGNEGSAAPSGLFALFAMPAITQEFVLNAVLAVIAAVLLIAFISRFIKRMEGK